jgi:hypothetical protein
LSEVARVEFSFDHAAESARLSARISALRETLGVRALDPSSTAAASDTSQNVVDLKTQRHELRERLRLARSQLGDQQALLDTLEHRIHSTKDLLRLKSAGLGRLQQVECPTCHRTVEAATLHLGTHSQESVSAHIEALERDRALVSMNRDATAADATAVAAELSRVEVALQSAERALAAVTVAVGPEREQLAKAALDLAAAERELGQNAAIAKELEEFQAAVDAWISEASSEGQESVDKGDIGRRVQAFEARLDELLRALGHSAVISGQQRVRLDDYVPYLGTRRLRSLGSASDHARLVAAYSLALAAASEEVHGPHPGIVVLDEPLQQNPDPVHRDLFLKFLESAAASRLKQQVLVFTSLSDTELVRLQASGVAIHNPREEHLLHRAKS